MSYESEHARQLVRQIVWSFVFGLTTGVVVGLGWLALVYLGLVA